MDSSLTQIKTFIYVVDFGSFTKTADYLNISRSIVSIRIRQLEEKLGTNLLIRNTRNFTLTELGLILYQDFKNIFSQIDSTLDKIQNKNNKLSGSLKIATPIDYGYKFVLPILEKFCDIHPDINVDCKFDSAPDNLISNKIDLAIRFKTGHDSSLKSRKLAEFSVFLVASPILIEKYNIKKFKDIYRVPWIINHALSQLNSFELTRTDGEQRILYIPRGKHFTNTGSATRQLALSSLGITILPDWLLEDDVKEGKLVALFPEYKFPVQSIYALYPSTTETPLKTRTFINFFIKQSINKSK